MACYEHHMMVVCRSNWLIVYVTGSAKVGLIADPSIAPIWNLVIWLLRIVLLWYLVTNIAGMYNTKVIVLQLEIWFTKVDFGRKSYKTPFHTSYTKVKVSEDHFSQFQQHGIALWNLIYDRMLSYLLVPPVYRFDSILLNFVEKMRTENFYLTLKM